MSRIGKQPVALNKTEATYANGTFTVKGPKGTLSRAFGNEVAIAIGAEEITLTPAKETALAKALWGTYAAHIQNMVKGVTEGFVKVLQVEGVGYRGEVKGSTLVMQLGFSHPVIVPIPAGVSVVIEKGVITISGIDKEVVGQFAANVRAHRKPEPYKGKGIRYQGEFILRKQGKKAT
ncbi:50S ribosomal protein L6 [Patescibacteria group bacterium]|nr:50S ribosomal protein L6 [Patescibacteria group bacterium]